MLSDYDKVRKMVLSILLNHQHLSKAVDGHVNGIAEAVAKGLCQFAEIKNKVGDAHQTLNVTKEKLEDEIGKLQGSCMHPISSLRKVLINEMWCEVKSCDLCGAEI